MKPLAPVGDGKLQAVLMRKIPRGSERQRKMLRVYAVMLVKSGMGISPQMPSWMKQFLRQYTPNTGFGGTLAALVLRNGFDFSQETNQLHVQTLLLHLTEFQ